jgi:hypothetical protein
MLSKLPVNVPHHGLFSPILDADIVCSRAKTHFDPTGDAFFSDSGTVSSQGAAAQLVLFKDNFKPLSAFAQNRMYFSVSFSSPSGRHHGDRDLM